MATTPLLSKVLRLASDSTLRDRVIQAVESYGGNAEFFGSYDDGIAYSTACRKIKDMKLQSGPFFIWQVNDKGHGPGGAIYCRALVTIEEWREIARLLKAGTSGPLVSSWLDKNSPGPIEVNSPKWWHKISVFSRIFGRKQPEPEGAPRRASTTKVTLAPNVTIDVPTDEVSQSARTPARKVQCRRCGAMILLSTAEETGGYCRNPKCGESKSPIPSGQGTAPEPKDPLKRPSEVTLAPKVTIDVPTDEVALRAFDESYGGTVEQFYAAMSKDLIARHGPLVKVDYVSHFPKFEIWLFYADGTTIYSGQRAGRYDINFLSLGYAGEGPRYAKSFLEAAGATLTSEDIESIEPGTSIQLSAGHVRIIRKEDQLSENGSGPVKFVREVQRIGATYRLYTSPDEQSAKDFLAAQDISVQSFFVVVKTPDGYLGKDRQVAFDASSLIMNLKLTW